MFLSSHGVVFPNPVESEARAEKPTIEKLSLEDFLLNREQRQLIGAGSAVKDAKRIVKFPSKSNM